MDKPQEKITDTNEKPKGAFPAVPTTKILAIGRLVAPLTPAQRKAILPRSAGYGSAVFGWQDRPMVVSPGWKRPRLPHERYLGRRGAGPAGETSFG
ncbi:MAG: hypothetical protein QOH31_1420 [Verrucomicrobiota bacterium]